MPKPKSGPPKRKDKYSDSRDRHLPASLNNIFPPVGKVRRVVVHKKVTHALTDDNRAKYKNKMWSLLAKNKCTVQNIDTSAKNKTYPSWSNFSEPPSSSSRHQHHYPPPRETPPSYPKTSCSPTFPPLPDSDPYLSQIAASLPTPPTPTQACSASMSSSSPV
mmetsp:Transcript_37369/g.78275  ORF Transcript_37369/g.78275 Transcript_37369/m.78275 type:complete len:162 (+) Transcript_37369:1381-1866(+)